MIRAIIFDLAGVIITGPKGIEKEFETKLNMSSEEIYRKFRGKNYWNFLNGKISEDEYWNNIITKNNWKIDSSLFKKAVRKHFKEIEGTKKIITNLKKRGYKLGILSAHSKEWIEYIKKEYNHEKSFDSVLYSYQVGYSKPDKRGYVRISEMMRINPKQCIYIDDKEKMLKPAKEIGITTILFESAVQLERDLEGVLKS